jgi:hypothetical protein
MQIFSLRLAKASINSGSVLLYGYMGAWDDMDGLLNYVFNRSRDDPIIVQQVHIIYICLQSLYIFLNSRNEMKPLHTSHGYLMSFKSVKRLG